MRLSLCLSLAGVNEAVVEVCVVTHQDCPPALICFHGIAHYFEQGLEHLLFRTGDSQWMIGVYAGELQRCRFDVGAVEGDNAMKVSLFYAREYPLSSMLKITAAISRMASVWRIESSGFEHR